MELGALLLLVAHRHRIAGGDAEAALEAFRKASGHPVAADEFMTSVASAVAAGDLHDPVRIAPGALQCSWRLELAPAGARKVAEMLARGDAR